MQRGMQPVEEISNGLVIAAMELRYVDGRDRLLCGDSLARLFQEFREFLVLHLARGGTNALKGVLCLRFAARQLVSGALKEDRKSTRLNSSHTVISYAV